MAGSCPIDTADTSRVFMVFRVRALHLLALAVRGEVHCRTCWRFDMDTLTTHASWWDSDAGACEQGRAFFLERRGN